MQPIEINTNLKYIKNKRAELILKEISKVEGYKCFKDSRLTVVQLISLFAMIEKPIRFDLLSSLPKLEELVVNLNLEIPNSKEYFLEILKYE